MNIAFFLIPKANLTYLYAHNSISKGIEVLRKSGYTAIPVITKDGAYVGSVSEGDFLWNLLDSGNGKRTVADLINQNRYKPVHITESMDALFEQILAQNFVPVVDDRERFMGIVTRRAVIESTIRETVSAFK